MVPNMSLSSTLEPGTLYNSRDFEDGTKLRIWRWGDYPGLARWAQGHHKGPYKREAGGAESEMEEGDVITGTGRKGDGMVPGP